MGRRVVAAVIGAGVAVGLAAWLAQPSPRVRIPVPGVQPDSHLDLLQAAPAGAVARWAFVRDLGHSRHWAFDHQTGRLAGPWPVPDAVRGYACDAAGRLYAHAGLGTSVSGFPLTVWWVEPETGRFTPRYELADRLHITPTAWDGEPAWLTFAGDPLRVEVIDLPTGAVRRRLVLPGRAGDLIDNGGPFAGDWAASDDGRWLAFGEAWDGLQRTTPPGVEVWDLRAGRPADRLTGYLPTVERFAGSEEPPDLGRCGSSSVRFAPDGRLRFASVLRHKPGTAVIPLLVGGRWQARVPGGPCEPDPAGDEPRLADLFYFHEANDVAGRRLYLGDVGREDDTPAFVVTGDDFRPLHPRRVLSHGVNRVRLTAWAAGVVVGSGRPGGPSADWLGQLLAWCGWPPFPPVDRLDWHDWRTGEVRRLGQYHGQNIDVACQPGGIVVCIHDPAAGRATLEVWADPPGARPPLPALLGVAAAGGLVGWAAGRPRRPRPVGRVVP